MAKRTTTRVTQKVLQQDRKIVAAVVALKDYNPANKEFTAQRLREALKELDEATALEQAAQEALTKAREAAMNIEGRFHDLILGAKRQVLAQYGDDSEEITRLGMKKKSERKYGRPKKNASAEKS